MRGVVILLFYKRSIIIRGIKMIIVEIRGIRKGLFNLKIFFESSSRDEPVDIGNKCSSMVVSTYFRMIKEIFKVYLFRRKIKFHTPIPVLVSVRESTTGSECITQLSKKVFCIIGRLDSQEDLELGVSEVLLLYGPFLLLINIEHVDHANETPI